MISSFRLDTSDEEDEVGIGIFIKDYTRRISLLTFSQSRRVLGLVSNCNASLHCLEGQNEKFKIKANIRLFYSVSEEDIPGDKIPYLTIPQFQACPSKQSINALRFMSRPLSRLGKGLVCSLPLG